MEVKVLFFGALAEAAGRTDKIYEDVQTVNDLENLLIQDFPAIEEYQYQISVNQTIVRKDRELSNKDEVALLPPFAGG